MYLKKIGWKKVSLTGSRGIEKVPRTPARNLARKMTIFASAVVVCVIIAIAWPHKRIHNPYRGVNSGVYSYLAIKPITIESLRLSFKNFENGVYPLSDRISIVQKGEGEAVDTDFDVVRYGLYNIEKSYLSPMTAADWISPSFMIRAGQRVTGGVSNENLSMAYSVVPYRDFQSNEIKINGGPALLTEPFLKNEGMQGLEGWDRLCADGVTRRVDFTEDTHVFLRPNEMRKIRNNDIDKQLGAPSLEPEETLVGAAVTFSNLQNDETGEWDIERTQRWVSSQYLIDYGYYIDPAMIDIVGLGANTRFVSRVDLSADMVVILDVRSGKEVAVPIVNQRNELLLYASADPQQSIVLPFAYLKRMEKDDLILLCPGDTPIEITFQDILDEIEQVRQNKMAQKTFLYPGGGGDYNETYLAAHVVQSPRMRKIADGLLAGATSKEEAIKRIMTFSARNLAYISDHKSSDGSSGPNEIPMSPMMALMNRGEDCEGDAIFADSLFLSTTNPIVGDNSTVALATLMYINNENKGIGHAIPMLPGFGTPDKPFPDHVVANNIPFGYFEATGKGANELHQIMPQRAGYMPQRIIVIRGNGSGRRLAVAGFNQFEYLHSDS